MNKKHILLLCLLCFFPFKAMGKPTSGEVIQEIEGRAQGTSYHIVYYGAERAKVATAIETLLSKIDKVFSNYRDDSSVSKFNSSQSTDWIEVEPELMRLVSESLSMSEDTRGAFDITIGQLLKLWGFGPYKRKTKASIPDSQDIALALKKVGYRNLTTRSHPPSLKKAFPDLLIDLSGVAQGYSVDRIAEVLDGMGVQSYLVELGGELRSKGRKAKGELWQVAIETATASSGSVARIVELENNSLSTSGDYRDFFELKGKRYSHIFDPRIGRPIETEVASATILTPLCQNADAYAKAFLILTDKEKRDIAARRNFSVMLQKHVGANLDISYIGEMQKHLSQ